MKQQILIVGAGFGGMWSALGAARLADMHDRADVEVTVLAPEAELRVRPRFYEPEVHQMKAPLGDLFDAVGVKFIKGAADRIDRGIRTATQQMKSMRAGEMGYTTTQVGDLVVEGATS